MHTCRPMPFTYILPNSVKYRCHFSPAIECVHQKFSKMSFLTLQSSRQTSQNLIMTQSCLCVEEQHLVYLLVSPLVFTCTMIFSFSEEFFFCQVLFTLSASLMESTVSSINRFGTTKKIKNGSQQISFVTYTKPMFLNHGIFKTMWTSTSKIPQRAMQALLRNQLCRLC